MPPRTTAAAAESTGAPAARSRAAARKKQPPADAPAPRDRIAPMETFAEHTGSRPFPIVAASDEKLNTRSFQLPTGVVERTRATSDGVQHLGYGTDLEGKAPDSISGLVTEALNAICTYYEDLLNNGQPFRRVRKLSPGARPAGAARGAAKRSETAAAKRAAKAKTD
jgi:hypothetical protein